MTFNAAALHYSQLTHFPCRHIFHHMPKMHLQFYSATLLKPVPCPAQAPLSLAGQDYIALPVYVCMCIFLSYLTQDLHFSLPEVPGLFQVPYALLVGYICVACCLFCHFHLSRCLCQFLWLGLGIRGQPVVRLFSFVCLSTLVLVC